ncbi:MAG: DsbA family protein [Dehalococcoidia bacterium]
MTPEPPDESVVPDAAPGEAPKPATRPVWQVLAVPIAIVLGAGLIAAGLAFGLRDDRGLTEAQVESALDRAIAKLPAGGPGEAASTAPAASAVARLSDALLAYAKGVGLDEAKFKACVAKPETVALLNKHFQQGVSLGVEGTPTFFVNNKRIVGAQPAAIFDEVIQAELSGSPTTLDGYSAAVKTLAQQGRFEIVTAKVDLTGAQITGGKNAKVMIAEFSDFQCPFCKTWTEGYYQRLRPRLGADIALAFLHFPITQIHPNAGTASAAAHCAGEQGKFWEMHDLLFSKQKEWQSLQ